MTRTLVFDDFDRELYRALRDHGPMSTAQLADHVHADRSFVYRRCRRMSHALSEVGVTGMSTRREPAARPLYWLPATGQVLTTATYVDVTEVVDGFGSVVNSVVKAERIQRGAKLTAAQCRKIERGFNQVIDEASEGKPGKIRAQLKQFREQVERVLGGTTLSDVANLQGLRPFRPDVRVWEVDAEAPDLPELLELPG